MRMRMLNETGCDGVMVATATLGNPFLFREIRTLLDTGKPEPRAGNEERILTCLEHVRGIVELFGETAGIQEIAQTCSAGTIAASQDARELIRQLFQVNTYAEVECYLARQWKPQEKMRHEEEVELESILAGVANGSIDIKDAIHLLKQSGVEDVGFARIDHGRRERCGFPEVIFAESKQPEQIVVIAKRIVASGEPLLITRLDEAKFKYLKNEASEAAI